MITILYIKYKKSVTFSIDSPWAFPTLIEKSHDIFVSGFTRDLISNSLKSEYLGYFGEFHFLRDYI